MTYLIPEIVTDVSAMLVDRMTFLLPWNRKQREHLQSGQTAMSNYRTNGSQNSRVWACLPAESSSSQMRTRSASTSRPCQLYLGSRLEDPELLSRRQRRVQRDHYHGAAAVGQVLCDVTARPCQSLDLLLACHEDQDVMGLRGLLSKNNNKNPPKKQGHQEQSSVRRNIVRCRERFHIELKGKEAMKKHIPQ